MDLGDGDIYVDGKPIGRAMDCKIKLTIDRHEAERIARERLEASVVRCVCGWFHTDSTADTCPSCGVSLNELTQWWREMDDRFWGMSRDQLREDFETWRVLNAEFIG